MAAAMRRIASSSLFYKVPRHNCSPKNIEFNSVQHLRRCSSNTSYNTYNDSDPAPFFFDKNIQSILKRVTGMNIEKIFRRRLQEKTLNPPRYEFLTDEEVQEHLERAKEKAETLLQMPPVVMERQPIQKVLEKNPALTGYDTCKYVFTDITFGTSDRNRLIVVRDVDGSLRQASWEERDRLNQVYNPAPGRSVVSPKLFQDDCLKSALAREEYLFVLDRACAQCEPDSHEYQRVASTVYEAVEDRRNYALLHSTRHYGPLCFYLTWHRKVDTLIISLIQQEKVSDAADIVHLYQLIHQDCKSAALNLDPTHHLDFIKGYLEHDSLQRPQLQLAIQSYEDLLHQRQQLQQQVTSAHGL